MSIPFEKINETNPSTNLKSLFYLNCILDFEQRTTTFGGGVGSIFSECDFGKKVCFIIPPHGDLWCSCKPCTIYRLVENEKKCGWRLINVKDHDNDHDDDSDHDNDHDSDHGENDDDNDHDDNDHEDNNK